MITPSKFIRNLPNWFILFIAALNGLLYLFLVPPWEHNDEPGNFEYAWLFANMGGKRGEWIGQTDQQMRREVASSMMEQGFFERHHPGYSPSLIVFDQEIWIGLKQDLGLPFYFWLVSLPLRLFRYSDIVLQLYVGRGVSLVLLLLTVYIAIQVNRELELSKVWGDSLPLLFTLFPSFVDKMTAVNDDVGAVAFFTLFLLFCIRILRKGLTLLNWMGLMVSIVLCVLTKRNVWISVPIGAIVLFFAVLPRWKLIRWVLFGVLLFIPLGIVSLDYRTPAFFYARYNQHLIEAIYSRQAIAGEGVAYLPIGKNLFLYQPLSEDRRELLGSRIRVGYWLWGSGDVSTSPMKVIVNGENILAGQPITLSRQPFLIQHTVSLPDSLEKLAVEVSIADWEEAEIFLDCIFLVLDNANFSQFPTPVDPNCRHISFGNSLAENLIRNGSFEQTWPRLHPWLENWVDDKFAFSITNLWSVLDVDVGLPYLRASGSHVFNTFWGRFGWGSVPLIGKDPYILFWIITAIILFGNLIALVQSKGKFAWDLGIVFFGSTALIIVMTLYRHGGNWIGYEATPNARYLMPAFLPLGLLIINGLTTLFSTLRLCKGFQNACWLGILFVYNSWAAVSIWSYYVPK